MVLTSESSFVRDFFDRVSEEMSRANPLMKPTSKQKSFLSFLVTAVIMFKKISWALFERSSFGEYSKAALSWMFKKSDISWDLLLKSGVKVTLEKYDLREGTLIIDDTDKKRSKSTTKIPHTHKVFDKKTSGFLMGQNVIFLILVTDKVTIPIDFAFYQPDPEFTAWNKEDRRLRKLKVPKSERPKKPAENPKFPKRITIALKMLNQFRLNFPQFKVKSVLADAAYGSSDFFKEAFQDQTAINVVSQLRSNQLIKHNDKWVAVSEVFKDIGLKKEVIFIRNVNQRVVHYASVFTKIKSMKTERLIVALKYENESECRYIVSKYSSLEPLSVVKTYTKRWLVEVFIQDWKEHEGWGQRALQQGVEGSHRGVILSVLVDLCLLFHPNQFARISKSKPACTVGSLCDHISYELILASLKEIVFSEKPKEKFEAFSNNILKYFQPRESKKHFSGRSLRSDAEDIDTPNENHTSYFSTA